MLEHPIIYKIQRRIRRLLSRFFPALVEHIDVLMMRGAVARLCSSGKLESRMVDDSPYKDDARLAQDTWVRVVAAADEVVFGKFCFLGGEVFYSDEIDWHRDFKSGYRWDPHLHYTRVPVFVDHPGADIKIPWELSRFQHVGALGLAWRHTRQRKYAECFKAHVLAWIESNPVDHGVNWVCSMDIAIRAVNWIAGWQLMHDAWRDDPDQARFLERLAHSLWRHALHIRRNLEWNGPQNPKRSNHFVSDLVGLLAMGAVFRDTRKGRAWLRYACRRLETEIHHQVLDDGVIHERATGYHRLDTELFLYAQTVAGLAGRPFGKRYADKLGKMREFIAAYSLEDGSFFQFGDQDDGRLMACGSLAAQTHLYLAPEEGRDGGSVFHSPDLYLLTGDARTGHRCSSRSSTHPESGFFILKGNHVSVMIRAGSLGYGGGHCHNDQLAFAMSVGGREIFADHGSYVYSTDVDQRNVFRGTRHHSTLCVNGQEQNPIRTDRGHLFLLPDRTATTVLEQRLDGAVLKIKAFHDGYAQCPKPVVLHRTFLLDKDNRRLEIIDEITGGGDEYTLEWNFHLHPEVEGGLDGAHAVVSRDGHRVVADASGELDPWSFVDCAHSPGYGLKQSCRCLRKTARIADLPASRKVVFRLEWKT